MSIIAMISATKISRVATSHHSEHFSLLAGGLTEEISAQGF